KYSFLLTLLAISGVMGVLSCKKDNLAVDVDPLNVPARAKFAYTDLNAPLTRTFYVADAAPGNMFNIPVGITTVSNQDRTIQLSYSSTTAVAGTHYTAPASIVIPAGQAVANLPITGNFANIAVGAAYVLKIKISGGDVPVFGSGRDSLMLTLRRYCPPSLTALGGNYTDTREYTAAGAFSYGPYTTSLNNLTMVAGSTTQATGTISNIYDDSWNDVNVTLDWTDPGNFKVTIPLQPTGKTYTGGLTHVRTSTAAAAVNTFSACERSLSFGIDLVNPTTGTVGSSNYKIVMK
ncbi:MAG TPA: hypothetical protein VF145_00500, partial [Chitinophagaceae bacterium]